jgi:hypothetical protein
MKSSGIGGSARTGGGGASIGCSSVIHDIFSLRER